MVALRNTRDHIPVIEGNCFGMLYGAALSFCHCPAERGRAYPSDGYRISDLLLYLAVFGSAIAWNVFNPYNIGADKAAYASVLFPIVALSISTVLESYQWTATSIIGVIMILAGNVISMADREKMLHWRERKLKKT